jgi:hypothetical protein
MEMDENNHKEIAPVRKCFWCIGATSFFSAFLMMPLINYQSETYAVSIFSIENSVFVLCLLIAALISSKTTRRIELLVTCPSLVVISYLLIPRMYTIQESPGVLCLYIALYVNILIFVITTAYSIKLFLTKK